MIKQHTDVGESAVRADNRDLGVVLMQIKCGLFVARARARIIEGCHVVKVLPIHEQTVRQVDRA